MAEMCGRMNAIKVCGVTNHTSNRNKILLQKNLFHRLALSSGGYVRPKKQYRGQSLKEAFRFRQGRKRNNGT